MNHLTGDKIWKYLEDELADSERELVDAHLDACDDCQDLMVTLLEHGGPLEEDHVVYGLFEREPMLQEPEPGFADRVMEGIRAEALQNLRDNVVPLRQSHRRTPPRLEVLTRFVTAAVVTGFMVLGSTQVQGTPMFGVLEKVGHTGTIVSDGTEKVYSEIHDLVSQMNSQLFK
jgi:hypothetical protein